MCSGNLIKLKMTSCWDFIFNVIFYMLIIDMKCNTEYNGAIAMDNMYLEFALYGVEMSL